MRRHTRVSPWFVLFCFLTGTVCMPAPGWSVGLNGFYSFRDDFRDGTYTDKWTAAVSGNASVRESGTMLDVAMSGLPGACSSAAIAQRDTFGFSSTMAADIVLRPAAGAWAGIRLLKDAANFVELAVGPEYVIINNMESGKRASHNVGGAVSYAGRDTTIRIAAYNHGLKFFGYATDMSTFTFAVNAVELGEVFNTQVGSGNLSLVLVNGYCPEESSTAHTYYDSVIVNTGVAGLSSRVSGRVADSRTGEGISFAGVATDTGGGGMTSPNGYYIIGAGFESELQVTVTAPGYSPGREMVPVTDLITIKDWDLVPVCPAVTIPEAVVFDSAGGAGSVSVAMTPQTGCGMGWLPEAGPEWMTLQGGADIRSGSGSVSYIVASHAGADPRIGTISLAGRTLRVAQKGTGRMAVPPASRAFEYAPVSSPFMSVDPAAAHPFAAGNLGDGDVDMDVGLPEFTGPVDVYLGFKMPAELRTEIWIIMPDLSVRPASQAVAPWRAGVTGPVYDGLYEKFPLSLLPSGRYELYTLVTPTGRLDSYYFWATHFTAP